MKTMHRCEPLQKKALSKIKEVKKESQSFTEKDNLGPRHDTFDIAVSYWWARNVAQKFDPCVLFIFDNEGDARDALLELDCIHVAEDTGNLICTETLMFGYYQRDDGRYDAVICGEELTHELWAKAKKSFEKHRGKLKNDAEPEKKVISESKKTQAIEEVIYVKEYSEEGLYGGTHTYRIYKAPDAAAAKAFLKRNPVNKPLYSIVVETPDGNWGRDIDGISQE